MIQRDTIFTNAALRPDGTPWWEGHDDPAPAEALDWQGRPWTPASSEKATHPNARFTTPATNCASLSPEFENPNGVPLDAIMFGARRQQRVPLGVRVKKWQHGVFSAPRSRRKRRPRPREKPACCVANPMAMLRSAVYNMGVTSSTGVDIAGKVTKPPKVFRVNWFRTDSRSKSSGPASAKTCASLNGVFGAGRRAPARQGNPIGIVPTPDRSIRTG